MFQRRVLSYLSLIKNISRGCPAQIKSYFGITNVDWVLQSCHVPLRRERERWISSISSPAVPRGAAWSSLPCVYWEKRVPQLNSRKVTGNAATHRRVCFTHAPFQSIDYFLPVGRKGRGRRVGRITGAGGWGDERTEGKPRFLFLALSLFWLSWRLSFFILSSYTHTH